MSKLALNRACWLRGALLAYIALSLAPSAGSAQSSAGAVEQRLFVLEHQSAADAVNLVYPYLSSAGAVELRPSRNALLIRDQGAVIDSVANLLRDFDRPAQSMQLEIQIVRAGTDEEGSSELSPELVSRLQRLLRYRSYSLVASSTVDASEGWDVLSTLGSDYEIDFRLGLVDTDQRVKLHGFRVLRRDGDSESKPLIHTNLNLLLDRPMVLGLAKTESSDQALMVVLHCKKRDKEVEK